MTIFLLGATGRTGTWIIEEVLKRGYQLHVLVRDKTKLDQSTPGLRVFEGVPTDMNALRRAMLGCDAVVSALNISRQSDFPWSKLRTPPHLLSDTMQLLTVLCHELAIKRIIIVSAWGVSETRADIPGWFRWFIDHSNIGPAYADHERQEKLLMASSLDWTIVRPVGLTNSKSEKQVKTSSNNEPRPSLTISRKNLAAFIVQQVESELYSGRAVVAYQ